MSKPPTGTQVQQLINSVKQLNRNVARCADTIRQLNVALTGLDVPSESETETRPSSNLSSQPIVPHKADCDLSSQPIVLHKSDCVLINIETVHGVRETIRIPKSKQ